MVIHACIYRNTWPSISAGSGWAPIPTPTSKAQSSVFCCLGERTTTLPVLFMGPSVCLPGAKYVSSPIILARKYGPSENEINGSKCWLFWLFVFKSVTGILEVFCVYILVWIRETSASDCIIFICNLIGFVLNLKNGSSVLFLIYIKIAITMRDRNVFCSIRRICMVLGCSSKYFRWTSN